MAEWLYTEALLAFVKEGDSEIAQNKLKSHDLSMNNQKFILINPSTKKRSFLNLIIRDIKYLYSIKIKPDHIVPMPHWVSAFWKVYKLSKIDVLSALKKVQKENVFIVRGKKDKFFCDEEVVDLIKKENITLIEVDAGHDWNQNIAEMVNKIICGTQQT